MWHKAVDWRLNCRRRDQKRLIAVTSGVQNLQRDFTALRMVRHRSPRGEALTAGIVQHRAAGHRQTPEGTGAIPPVTINATPCRARRHNAASARRHQDVSTVHRSQQSTRFLRVVKPRSSWGEQRRQLISVSSSVKLLLRGRMSYHCSRREVKGKGECGDCDGFKRVCDPEKQAG